MAPRGTSRRIAEEVRERIRDGSMPPGTLLPSEMQLVDEHGVARGTVRAALGLLLDEGIIEVVPGVGRRVAGSAPVRGSDAAYQRIAADLTEQVQRAHFEPETPLPSEAMLVAEYGVSRNTVRRAYRLLIESGLVVVRHGAGAFVRR